MPVLTKPKANMIKKEILSSKRDNIPRGFVIAQDKNGRSAVWAGETKPGSARGKAGSFKWKDDPSSKFTVISYGYAKVIGPKIVLQCKGKKQKKLLQRACLDFFKGEFDIAWKLGWIKIGVIPGLDLDDDEDAAEESDGANPTDENDADTGRTYDDAAIADAENGLSAEDDEDSGASEEESEVGDDEAIDNPDHVDADRPKHPPLSQELAERAGNVVKLALQTAVASGMTAAAQQMDHIREGLSSQICDMLEATPEAMRADRLARVTLFFSQLSNIGDAIDRLNGAGSDDKQDDNALKAQTSGPVALDELVEQLLLYGRSVLEKAGIYNDCEIGTEKVQELKRIAAKQWKRLPRGDNQAEGIQKFLGIMHKYLDNAEGTRKLLSPRMKGEPPKPNKAGYDYEAMFSLFHDAMSRWNSTWKVAEAAFGAMKSDYDTLSEGAPERWNTIEPYLYQINDGISSKVAAIAGSETSAPAIATAIAEVRKSQKALKANPLRHLDTYPVLGGTVNIPLGEALEELAIVLGGLEEAR